MRSYAIDTLFDSEYYTGDTEEIETTEALCAPVYRSHQERGTQSHFGYQNSSATHQHCNRLRKERRTTASVED